jgi:hypothetical protein
VLREGDIIFQSRDQRRAERLTRDEQPLQRMGILYRENGDWFAFEAVQPVKLTFARMD